MQYSNWNPGGFEIIDAHVHPVNPPGQDMSMFEDKLTPEKFVSELKRVGISRCAGSVIAQIKEGDDAAQKIEQLNNANLAFYQEFPDFYIPSVQVHPFAVETSLRTMEKAFKEQGVRLIGELVAYMMNYDDYNTPALDPVWDLAQELGMTVSLHKNCTEEVRILLKRFPRLHLILAHPSMTPSEYDARLDTVKAYPYAALDISGSGPNMWGMLRHGIRRAGKEKLLFATDFPLRNPGMYVAGVYAERLADDEFEAVFAKNFKRLLNIQ